MRECEIVKNSALGKEFFYCRTHKKEAINSLWCTSDTQDSVNSPGAKSTIAIFNGNAYEVQEEVTPHGTIVYGYKLVGGSVC